MAVQIDAASTVDRAGYIRRGLVLESITIAYNSLEGLIAIIAGIMAGSIALVGFGADSVIEVTSGLGLVWRLRKDSRPADRERAERVSLRIVGACFVALALYVAWDAVTALIQSEAPQRVVPLTGGLHQRQIGFRGEVQRGELARIVLAECRRGYHRGIVG
jgi:divalent metal cation (Fe/Co/Zn/Cd) transporter